MDQTEYKVKIDLDAELFRELYGRKVKSIVETRKISDVERKEGKYTLKIGIPISDLGNFKKQGFIDFKDYNK